MPTYTGTTEADTFRGTTQNDVFFFTPANLSSSDRVSGGDGVDTLALSGTGFVDASVFFGVFTTEVLRFVNGGITVTMAEAARRLPFTSLRIEGSTGDDTFNGAGAAGVAFDFRAGAGNDTFVGNGNSTFRFAINELNAGDRISGGMLVFETAGTIAAPAFANVTGIYRVVLANGVNDITLAGLGTYNPEIVGGTGNDRIDASAAGQVDISSGGGFDTLFGGRGSNTFRFAASELAGDRVIGFDGVSLGFNDTIRVEGAADVLTAADLGGLRGVEIITFGTAGHSLILNNAVIRNNGAQLLSVRGSFGNDVVDASAVTFADQSIAFVANGGNDRFIGGRERDFLTFQANALDLRDQIDGGAGIDRLTVQNSGNVFTFVPNAFANIRNIEDLRLTGSYLGTLTLTADNIGDGAGGLLSVTLSSTSTGGGTFTLDARSLNATNRLDLSVIGAQGSLSLFGGSGDDVFRFTSDFSGQAVDGGAGYDELRIADRAATSIAAFANVSGVEQVTLAGLNDALFVDDAFMARNATTLIVRNSSRAGRVDASGITDARYAIDVTGGRRDASLIGGAGADIFRVSVVGGYPIRGGDGAAQDTLQIDLPYDYAASAFSDVSGIERIMLATPGTRVALSDALVTSAYDRNIVVSGSEGDDTINGRAVTTAANSLDILAGAGADTLYGGAGDDTFHFDAAELTLADVVSGGAGSDRLLLRSAGAATLGGNVSSIETLSLGTDGTAATLTDAFAAGNPGRLAVRGGAGGQTLDASAVTRTDFAVETITGAGDDTLRGGAGNDVFRFAHLDLTGADIVAGGAGTDTLLFLTSGGINLARLAGVSGIERIVLAGGNDTLTLPAALVASAAGRTVRIDAGAGRDTIDGGYAGSAGRLELFGGDGDDTLQGTNGADWIEGGQGADTLLGRAGADTFRFGSRAEAGDTILDWVSADDTLSFEAGAFAFNGPAFDTVRIALTAADGIEGADLVRYTGGPIDSAAALMTYLVQNGTGDAGAGLFVAANTGGNETVLYHVTDASGASGDAALVARFGAGTSAYSFRLDDFAFT